MKIVKAILVKYHYVFYAYGSRVQGRHKKFSDLDLCFKENIPWDIRSYIEEDFEESDLPFEVSLLDYNACDQNFQNLIKNDLQLISDRSANA